MVNDIAMDTPASITLLLSPGVQDGTVTERVVVDAEKQHGAESGTTNYGSTMVRQGAPARCWLHHTDVQASCEAELKRGKIHRHLPCGRLRRPLYCIHPALPMAQTTVVSERPHKS